MCLVVLACGVGAAEGQFVHARGKRIVDGAGRELRLHGINLGNWMVPEGYMWHFDGGPQSPREIEELVTELIGPGRAREFWRTYRDGYITREDIRQIKAMGFDSVRVPIHFKLFGAEDAEGFRLLDRVVGWCREEGLLVVIDLHAAPGGQTGTNIDDGDGYPWLFEDATAQEQAVALWTRIARHYRDETAVMGYDLLNEPIPNYPELRRLDHLLEPLYKRLVAGIRTVDNHHMVILGGAQWDGDFTVFGPPFDGNAAYQLHVYWTPPVQAAVQKYVDFRARMGVPVWLGESGENTDEWVGQFARVLEKNGIGWAFWPYKKMAATSSPVSYAQPEGWGEITAYAKLARGTGEVKERLAKRPRQEVIDKAFAGLLENIRFDRERRNAGYVQALLPGGRMEP
jgi:hypothetical protein